MIVLSLPALSHHVPGSASGWFLARTIQLKGEIGDTPKDFQRMNEEDSVIHRKNGDFLYLNRCKQDKASQISQQRA